MPILAICRTSLLIVGLDATIVNVALPSIRRDRLLTGRLPPLRPGDQPARSRDLPDGPGARGSMLNPVAMSIIRNTFDDSREPAQAIGWWGATVGISLALGPVVGGVLVGSVGWPVRSRVCALPIAA